MIIPRVLAETIKGKIINSNKAVIIYGARQMGKTTLSNEIIKAMNLKTIRINADQTKYIDIFSSRDVYKLRSFVHGYELLFIDEAQRIPEIGINLKILIDEIPELKILVTGSSSIGIADRVSEPLTGRKWTYTLYPLSLQELSAEKSQFEINEMLEELLIYGSYPEVYTTKNRKEKEELLIEISDSYLYKDILELSSIKHPGKIRDLLRLLAFQVGSEVSILELSRTLGINRETVENYIYLLEKSFVLFRLSGFSRNLRKEISKHDKFYFFDNGIRNVLINNLNDLNLRNDIGQLWENFIISERIKYLNYNRISMSSFFWRTYTGAELDYIEEGKGKLTGFEIKYSKIKKKPPSSWTENYPNAEFQSICKTNYQDFLINQIAQ